MEIKGLKVKNHVFLAPMAEVNDIAFRVLCKKAGCGLTYTGMINPRTKKELGLDDNPAIQLFGTGEIGINDFIKKYENKAPMFDFNLGCPAKNARKLGFGAFFNDLEKIEKILKVMRKATRKPISIKIRKSKNTGKLLKLAEKYCDAICVHPRTLNQGYSGKADIKFALKIKKKSKIPVIYSGDVDEENFHELLGKFDYVMVGRKAFGNPGIFAKITGKKILLDFFDYLKLAKKYKLKFSQIKLHAMAFTKGSEGGARKRERLVHVRGLGELVEIMKEE